MTWNSNIPVSSGQIRNSPPNFIANNNAIQAALGNQHAFSAADGYTGAHTPTFIASLGIIPSGVNMCFYQTTSPTGWTLNTALDDKVIKIDSAAGGSTGGTWTISGLSSASAGSHYHTTGSHTLSISEIPSHTHTYTDRSLTEWQSGNSNKYRIGDRTINTGATGGGLSHNHGDTSTAGAHTHTISEDGTWRPAYAAFIVASKD